LSVDHAKASGAGRVNAKARDSVSCKGIREYRVVEQIGDDILELKANALHNLDVLHDSSRRLIVAHGTNTFSAFDPSAYSVDTDITIRSLPSRAEQMSDFYAGLIDSYPLVSIEDPLSEALIQGEVVAPAALEVIVTNESLYYRSVNDKLVGATPLST